MKRALHLTLVALLFTTLSAKAQYTYFTEYFDDGALAITGTTASAATTPTAATIKTGSWTTYYSFRAGSGCTPQDPAVTSAKQLRILATTASSPSGLSSNPNGPYAYLITPTLNFGVNVVSWKNLSTSTSGATAIYTSTNNGSSWTLFQSVSTLSTACSDYSVTINNSAVNKIKFQNETGSNQEIDNITITSVNPILPISIAAFKIAPKETGVQLAWSTATESNADKFVIERSTNAREYQAITEVVAKGNSSTLVNYSYFDANPVKGVNYYRIKLVDKDGSFKYSNTLSVNLSGTKSDLTVSPNPVRGNQLNIQLSSLTKGEYSLKLYNDLGQVVFAQQLSTEGGSLSQSFTLPSSVKPGMYNLQVSGNEAKLSKRIVVQ